MIFETLMNSAMILLIIWPFIKKHRSGVSRALAQGVWALLDPTYVTHVEEECKLFAKDIISKNWENPGNIATLAFKSATLIVLVGKLAIAALGTVYCNHYLTIVFIISTILRLPIAWHMYCRITYYINNPHLFSKFVTHDVSILK